MIQLLSPKSTRMLVLLVCLFNCKLSSAQDIKNQTSLPQLLQKSKTAVFLGDSITAAGQYVAYTEVWIASQKWSQSPKILNLGLSSETVSGLSEDGHAGGKFPRPDLAERLDRVLAITKPNLVFACYGINCGIYQPFDETRFQQYQKGYLQLKQKVEAIGANLIIITPPFYDDLRMPLSGFSYNDVLSKYAQWLVSQREQGWRVIDLHSAMTKEIQAKRITDSSYFVQPDGVHPNAAGHWCVAKHLIEGLGGPKADESTLENLLQSAGLNDAQMALIQKRVLLLRDAYVGAAGHKRPGVPAGLPVEEAEKEASAIYAKAFDK